MQKIPVHKHVREHLPQLATAEITSRITQRALDECLIDNCFLHKKHRHAQTDDPVHGMVRAGKFGFVENGVGHDAATEMTKSGKA